MIEENALISNDISEVNIPARSILNKPVLHKYGLCYNVIFYYLYSCVTMNVLYIPLTIFIHAYSVYMFFLYQIIWFE